MYGMFSDCPSCLEVTDVTTADPFVCRARPRPHHLRTMAPLRSVACFVAVYVGTFCGAFVAPGPAQRVRGESRNAHRDYHVSSGFDF